MGNIGDGGKGPFDDLIKKPGEADGEIAPSVMHRLNKTEYANTMRDLLKTQLDPSQNFPADDISFGFDNVASVLTLSPLHFELYESSATTLAQEALLIPTSSLLEHFEAENLTGDNGSATGSAWALVSNGEVGTSVDLSEGDYIISARVWGQQAGPDNAQAALLVGGVTLDTFDVPADQNNPQVITVTAPMTAGTQMVSVAFLNDYYMPPDDRNLYIDWIEVEGPLGSVSQNPVREEIVHCDPSDATCRRQIAGDFASRAWRRPATDEEVDALVALYDVAIQEGDSSDVGLELILRGALLSPHFVFRPELDDDPDSTTSHPLTDYEIASRLSYFLWSSMPDEELFNAAATGELQDEAGLRSEVDRMLADDKASALVENFAGQWLLLRALEDHVPDYATYPDYDETLRLSLKQETELFFTEFVLGNIGLNKLLSAEFTYLNDRLATHYNVSFGGGSTHERVDLPGNAERFGLLTQGSLLTVTSFPNRTSPVKRGVFIMEQLMCSGPPPPPPGVEGLVEEIDPTDSLRDRLAQHRNDPTCNSCHETMDNLGFGLEAYSGIGAFRTIDEAGHAVDSSGVYYGDESFEGARQMAELIENDPSFLECIAEKLFVYGLGRGVESEDKEHIEHIVEQATEADYSMPELIKLIVTSEPFRYRRGVAEEDSP